LRISRGKKSYAIATSTSSYGQSMETFMAKMFQKILEVKANYRLNRMLSNACKNYSKKTICLTAVELLLVDLLQSRIFFYYKIIEKMHSWICNY
jgi:hypothetical protein